MKIIIEIDNPTDYQLDVLKTLSNRSVDNEVVYSDRPTAELMKFVDSNDWKLPTRVKNAILHNRIHTMAQLRDLVLSGEITSYKGFGKGTRNLLKNILFESG